MALTQFQRAVCRLIALHRIQSGESYVAGGAAMNTLSGSPRISRDIDLFHDTAESVAASGEAAAALWTHCRESRRVRVRARVNPYPRPPTLL